MLGPTSLERGEFVTVDIETTGCRPGRNEIIEIGAVRVRAGEVDETFSLLVGGTDPIPRTIQSLTGITNDMRVGATDIGTALYAFREFVGDAVLVAHNYRFDLGFLDYEAERAWGGPFVRPVLDTLALARRLHPELKRHNLTSLAEFYGSEARPTHRAGDDALATAEILVRMMSELTSRGLSTAEDAAAFCGLGKQRYLADKLVLSTGLPDAPGVYLFRNDDGVVVYVGRARSLRAKVRSAFYGSSEEESAAPALEVAEIGWYRVVGDLDAILLESRLLSRYDPHFNRKHERGRTSALIHVDTTSPFPGLKVTDKPRQRGIMIGPFTNRWATETLVEHLVACYGLRRCTRRLTPALANRACQHRERGTCPRPCVAEISNEDYAERLDRALRVFTDSSESLRAALQSLREQSAEDMRYEDAIRYRDAIRALDRSLSALHVIEDSTRHVGVVIVESGAGRVAFHLVRRGYLVRTLRFDREEVETGRHACTLESALESVYCAARDGDDPLRYTSRQLRDVFLIHSFRTQQDPVEIVVGSHHAATLRDINAALGSLGSDRH